MHTSIRSGGRRTVAPRTIARKGLAGLATAALVAGIVTVSAGVASAAVPEFPNNVVVFPDRDFVTIEGYQEYVGQDALVEVVRGSDVVGSSLVTVKAGDPAFEINHVGEACWGQGTNLQVTPDIVPGDVVRIKIGGVNLGETKVADAYVTNVAHTSGSRDVVITGHVGDDVNRQQLEQRIINPDLKDTAVGRRDARATEPTLTADTGYSSSLTTSGNSFTATYQFDDATAAAIAAEGGPRMMSWQVQDADANRQGLTIAEFGEVGGPGMGGCPNGPLQTGPAGPTDTVATQVSDGFRINWTPAVAIPGTPAITGYQVTALGAVNGAEQATVGKRITGQSVRSTTIKVDPNSNWTFEIVSISSAGQTFPAVEFQPQPVDTKAPTITADPPGNSYATAQQVALKSDESNTDIYYTLGADKSPIQDADNTSPDAQPYTGPIDIAADTVLRFVGFDVTGNRSEVVEETYTITNTPAPAASTEAQATLSANAADITWKNADASVDSFTVDVTPNSGVAIGPVTEVSEGSFKASLTGLTADQVYSVTITANNENGSTATKLADFTAKGSVTANAGADITAKRNTVVTLDGSASTGTEYLWEQVLPANAAAGDKVLLSDTKAAKPSFSLGFYKYPMSNGPLTFRLTVTGGGVTKTDEVKVNIANDRVTIGSARYKARDFRIIGTASTVGAVVTVRNATTNAVIGTAQVVAAVAPETGGTWELRLRTNVPANPGQVVADSNLGGTSAPFAVTAG